MMTAHADPVPAPAAAAGAGGGVGSGGVLPGEEVSPFRFKVADARMQLPESALDLAYWTYTVRTTCTPGTARLDWPEKEAQVRHRFSDFVWLREELQREYAGCIVPPLPEKDLTGQVEKLVLRDQNLLNYRQRGLTRFLAAVGTHPTLRRDALFRDFCTLPAEGGAWGARKAARRAERRDGGAGAALARRAGGWAARIGGKKDDPADGPPERLEQRRNHARSMSEALGTARDRLRGWVAQRREVAGALEQLATTLAAVGDVEARAVPHPLADTQLACDLQGTGAYAGRLAAVQRDHAEKEQLLVAETLGFYSGLYFTIKEECKRLQRDHSAARAAAREGGGGATALEAAAAAHAAALARFDADWERFHRTKEHDLARMQRTLAELQVAYLRRSEQADPPRIEDPSFDDM